MLATKCESERFAAWWSNNFQLASYVGYAVFLKILLDTPFYNCTRVVMRKKAIAAIAVILVIIFIVPFIISYWNSLPEASYKIDDEIKGFPVNELSLTVWNCYTTNESVQGLPESPFGVEVQLVILNVSIHNLVNRGLFFNGTDDFHARLVKAVSQYLVLEYGGKVGQGTDTGLASYLMPSGDIDWWGVALNVSSFDWLGANQSINGSMYFRIGPGLAPEELICKSMLETKPIFAVDLTQ